MRIFSILCAAGAIALSIAPTSVRAQPSLSIHGAPITADGSAAARPVAAS